MPPTAAASPLSWSSKLSARRSSVLVDERRREENERAIAARNLGLGLGEKTKKEKRAGLALVGVLDENFYSSF